MISDCPQKLADFVNRLRNIDLPVEEVVNSQGDNPSRRFDIEGNKSLGRIVLWNSNEWEFEVISIESGELVFWKSLDQPDDQNLSDALATWEFHMRT